MKLFCYITTMMFSYLHYICYFCILLVAIRGSDSIISYKTTTTYKDESVFVYPGQARSERDLFPCAKNAVCSIIHKRFWMPQQVERFCRCDSLEQQCSSKYSTEPDNYTMALYNRAQLKFCDPVGELPNCLENGTLLTAQYQKEGDNVKIMSEATCYCPQKTMWKLHQRIFHDMRNGTTLLTDSYRCSELDMCNSDEFCGYIRADTFSTYYRCSCPIEHICINKENEIRNVSLPFFSGETYKAICIKMPFLQTTTKEDC